MEFLAEGSCFVRKTPHRKLDSPQDAYSGVMGAEHPTWIRIAGLVVFWECVSACVFVSGSWDGTRVSAESKVREMKKYGVSRAWKAMQLNVREDTTFRACFPDKSPSG